MAVAKGSAVEALRRAEEARAAHDQRVSEARKAAAVELGQIVLATGADRLPIAELKAVLTAAVKARTESGRKPPASGAVNGKSGPEQSGERGGENGIA